MTTVGSGSWLRRFHPKLDVAGRLILLPHAGGAASYFHPLSRLLASAPIDVVVVQYPGRQDRADEPLIPDITVLAEHVTDALRGWTDQPLAFLGHSMGATVAFETARRMQAAGANVTNLFVSARIAPSCPRREDIDLTDDRALLAEVMSLDGTESTLLDDKDLLDMVMPAIRNDYAAVGSYRYRPGPDVTCPITALVGEEDDKVTREEAQTWATHTTGPFELHSYTGGHFYLDKHREAIAKLLTDSIPN